jgi:hypothetical protein
MLIFIWGFPFDKSVPGIVSHQFLALYRVFWLN